MKISACVIVKNEEKNLPRWLESMQRIADEIVVVDTGSTDGTVSVAEAAGVRVEYFKWVNDFAAAKNYAIEQAAGDWILMPDADEYFPLEDCGKVRQAIERYDRNQGIVALLFHRIEFDQAAEQRLGMEAYVIRCFRNVSWMRYEGIVHESLAPSWEKGMRIAQLVPDVTLHHTGYSRELVPEKLKRNLALLEEADRRGQARDVDDVYFADCYFGLHDYEKAAYHAKRAVNLRVKLIGMENRPHTVLIQSMMAARFPSSEIYEAIAGALHRYPRMAEYYLLWGLEDWNCEDYAEAEGHFLKGLELYAREISGNVQGTLTSHAENFLETVYFHLAEIFNWKGNREIAAEYLTEVLNRQSRNETAWKMLCRILKKTSSEKQKDFFGRLYPGEAAAEFLGKIMGRMDMGDMALFYEAASGRTLFDSFERYLMKGNLSGAADELKRSMKDA